MAGRDLSVYQNEWIVQFTRDALAQVHSVAEVAGLFPAEAFSFEVIGGLGPPARSWCGPRGRPADAVSDWLAQTADVAYYEPNAILPVSQVPNDPSFGSAWGLHNTGQTSADRRASPTPTSTPPRPGTSPPAAPASWSA